MNSKLTTALAAVCVTGSAMFFSQQVGASTYEINNFPVGGKHYHWPYHD
jgi:hypothetical protein